MGYVIVHAMMPLRTLTLVFWLAIVLGTALGALVPASALAHPGHGSGPAQITPTATSAATLTVTSAAWLADDASPESLDAVAAGEAPGVVRAIPGRVAVEAVSCGGASCCGTGHGCCAAIACVSPMTGASPRQAPLNTLLAGLPSGLGASTLAEPPRPLR